MPFGQVVVGAPAAGKTIYCNGMGQFMTALGRKVSIINLDPANYITPYTPTIDIRTLVSLEDVMERTELGPNGGLVYCIEYLEKNLDWLIDQLDVLPYDHYLLFDCPGQIELYTHHQSMRNILEKLQQKGKYRLTTLFLVDSFHCSSASNYISAVLLALSSMLRLEMPHINVLSKIDLIEKHGELDFNLDFYTEVQDLSYILPYLSDSKSGTTKFAKLKKAICGLIEDFSLVGFIPLDINDKESVNKLLRKIDKSNGYVYGAFEKENTSIMEVSEYNDQDYTNSLEVQERYFKNREHISDEEEGEDHNESLNFDLDDNT